MWKYARKRKKGEWIEEGLRRRRSGEEDSRGEGAFGGD